MELLSSRLLRDGHLGSGRLRVRARVRARARARARARVRVRVRVRVLGRDTHQEALAEPHP